MPEPGDKSGDPLQIPAVSRDGSHILMASGGTGPCGHETCPELPCRGTFYGEAARCPMQPSRLYMRVSTGIPRTYEVSRGHYVEYVGADAAGTKVYFLSDEQLTPEDQDSSTDLYLWTEETDSITLVSKANVLGGPGEAGNSDDCTGGIETQQELHDDEVRRCHLHAVVLLRSANEDQGGGNCLSDNSIAPDSGDIYFYSPEQLDGLRGVPDQQNLYVYHEGKVHYVTTLTGPPDCYEVNIGSFCRRMIRMQVSGDGKYMAFLTASPITPYDNDGRREMYRYARDTRELVCVSCIPDGSKPTFDVAASQDGLFMSDDGRAFFTTEDALVHADTNRAQDVYEYVEGRPQLITLGTGDTRAPGGHLRQTRRRTGLAGVSADGTDVFFSTYDTLVRQDRNGLFLKFYDARSGGGFPAPPPPPPCEAADECHGDSSQRADGRSRTAPGRPWAQGATSRQAAEEQEEAGKRKKRKRTASGHGKKARQAGRPPEREGREMSIACRNRLRSAVAALACRSLLGAWRSQASRADANTPILHYSTLPSTSQAGGHPDVAISFKVANRLVQESQSLCNCEDAKDATVHFPPGLIGNPSATPKCTIADFSADDCPIDSQVGMTFVNTGPGIPIQFLVAPSTTSCRRRSRRPHRVQALPLRLGAVHRAQPAHRQRLRPRRDRHLDLPRRREFRCGSSNSSSGGSPQTRSHDALRINLNKAISSRRLDPLRGRILRRGRRTERRRPEVDGQSLRRRQSGPVEQPADAVPPESDDLRRTARNDLRRPLLRRGHHPYGGLPGLRPRAATSSASTRASTPSRPRSRPIPPRASTSI